MSARIAPGGGSSNVATGIPVLDHLLGQLARSGGFELALELPPGEGEAEVAAAGAALGESFADILRADGLPGHGSAFMPAEEALAQIVFEVSEQPLVHSNVDLTEARAGGLGGDLAARFLDAFADAAGVTLHVRLIDGEDSRHVLEAIFKALGAALAAASAPAQMSIRGSGCSSREDPEGPLRGQPVHEPRGDTCPRRRSSAPSARPRRSRERRTTRP